MSIPQAMHDILVDTLTSSGGVDLHSHTNHSDGFWEPAALVEDAARAGISVLAVTDHDTVAGLAEAQSAALAQAMALIPGVEVTLTHRQNPYHLLCYDLDPCSGTWAEVQRHRQQGQQQYYRRLLEMIREAGYDAKDETVLQDDGTYSPHSATGALQAAGYADTYESAQALLNSLHLRYPWELLAMDSYALAELMEPGEALCVVAHAARTERGVCVGATSQDIGELKQMLPLVGLEAYHPYHSQVDIGYCLDLCTEHRLGTTTGSDAHGWNVRRPPRAHPADLSRRLLEMIHERWS